MFRRKEDSLFDNATDDSQALPGESANVISQPAQAAAPSSLSGGSVYGSNAAAAPRPPSAPQNNSFRASPAPAPIGSDLTRSRLPEAKPTTMAAPTVAPAPSPSPSPSISEKSGSKSVRRVLTVGNDILLKGEIATCDRLVIEGKVDATLNDVHTVEIAENGSFRGSANIEDAEISGLFEGDLVVRNRLVIYATGKVRGKITYGEIEIERGGELSGEIKSGSSASASVSGPRPPRQAVKQDDKVAA